MRNLKRRLNWKPSLKGRINSLEEERNALKGKISRFENVMPMMKKEINELRAVKGSGEVAKFKKEVKKLEAKAEDLIEKVETLTKEKANAVATATRWERMCDHLQESLDRTKVRAEAAENSKCCQ